MVEFCLYKFRLSIHWFTWNTSCIFTNNSLDINCLYKLILFCKQGVRLYHFNMQLSAKYNYTKFCNGKNVMKHACRRTHWGSFWSGRSRLSCNLGLEMVRLCLEQRRAEDLRGSLSMGFPGLAVSVSQRPGIWSTSSKRQRTDWSAAHICKLRYNRRCVLNRLRC